MAKTYGTVTTFSSGSVLTAAQLNVAGGAVNNLVVPPSARVARTANLTAYASGADISWQTSTAANCHDTDAMWSAGTPARLTVTTAGIYLVTLSVYLSFAGTATQYGCQIRKNAGAIGMNYFRGSATLDAFVSTSAVVACISGDFFVASGLLVGTTAGSNVVNFSESTNFSATWVGRTV